MSQSIVEQLDMLRAFVGGDYSESDLSKSLRLAGYNVQAAAERILTGGFQSNMTASSITAAKPSVSTTPAPMKRKPVVTPKTAPKRPRSSRLPLSSLLLCQRWISDGVCTQRNGACDYQEELQVEVVRESLFFRGRRMQGQFPKALNACLGPLMRQGLVAVTAQALMEDRGVPMGAHVAFSVRCVYFFVIVYCSLIC